MSSTTAEFISFSKTIFALHEDKITLWSRGEGELSEACRKIKEAAQEAEK